MRDLIIFGLFIILLLVAQFASAKTVDDIIGRHLRALGGSRRLAGVNSIYMEGIKEMMGEQLTVNIMKEQDRLSRTQIESENAKNVVLITANHGWTFFSEKSPVVQKIPDEALGGYKIEMDITGPLVDYIAKGYKAELLGKETVDDTACYKIKLSTEAGKVIMFWVDTNNYLVYQSSGSTFGIAVNEFPVLHKNYKAIDGIQFAHTFEPVNTSGNVAGSDGTLIFSKITVNPFVDPKMYQPQ